MTATTSEDEFASLDDDEFDAPDDSSKPGAVKIRNGRYALPDPLTGKERLWTRVSTIAKTLADTYRFDRWNGRMVARGMALRPDLVSLAGQYDVTEHRDELNDIAAKAKEAAGGSVGANLGTALHGYAERLDRGEAVFAQRLAPGTRRSLELYRETLTENRMEVMPEFMERVVLNYQYGIVGRLDRLYRVATYAHPIVGDLKSQKTLDFGYMEIAMQMALYANGDYMWNEDTAEWESMPTVNRMTGLIVHVPAQRPRGQEICEIHRVDLAAGWKYVRLAMSVRTARKATYALGRPAGKELYWRARLSEARTLGEASSIFRQAFERGEWSDHLNDFAKELRERLDNGESPHHD